MARPFAFRWIASVLGAISLPLLAAAQSVVLWGSFAPPLETPLTGVTQVAAGNGFALALRTDGSVAMWNESGLRNVPARVKDVEEIAAGPQHSLARKRDGTVVAWGTDFEGETIVPSGLKRVVGVAAGSYHSLALKADGTVAFWGYDNKGAWPLPSGLSGVVGVAAGSFHSLALKSDGTVIAWGSNGANQCDVPAGLTDVIQVAAGGDQSLALKSDGTVVGWGAFTARPPSTLKDVVRIAAGGTHSLALKSDGTVTAWGNSNNGKTRVPFPLSGVTAIAAGGDFSMAVGNLLSVSTDRQEIYAGESAVGIVNIHAPAGPGGATVALRSSQSSVEVPAWVNVPEGATSATFPIVSRLSFGSGLSVRITASYNGDSAEWERLFVVQNRVVPTLNRESFIGGSSTKPILTLTLDWSLSEETSFSLKTSDPALSLPASVTFGAGQKSLRVHVGHDVVPSDRSARLSALYTGREASRVEVRVRAIRGTLAITPDVLKKGEAATGTVVLSGFVQKPLSIPLASGHPSLSVPASVTVPAGERTVTFPVSATGSGNGSVEVTATINGQPVRASVYVGLAPVLKSVELPSRGYGLAKIPVRVRLERSAPTEGVLVGLVSSDPALQVPATVRIAEGSYYADVEATTDDFEAATRARVTASAGDSSASDSMDLTPVGVHDVVIAPKVLRGGESFQLTVVLNAEVRQNARVQISVSDATLVQLPSQTIVYAGVRSRTITVKTRATSASKKILVTITKNGTSRSETVRLTPD